jgi:hypothetical protein
MHIHNTPHTTIYRNIKYPRLELKTGTLVLILPKDCKNKEQLLLKHEKWIKQKQQTIQKAIQRAKTTKLNQTRTLPQLKTLIANLTEQYKSELNTKTNKILYRKMKTKWASLSQNRNLTINTLTRHLPENLIQYIIYHELTHAKHGKNHNTTFWKQITAHYPNHNKLENQLLAHWFQIQQTQTSSGYETETSKTP